jgi:GTP-binding protein YchF
MSLRTGIIGLPNAGKSSLFKALTGQEIAIENFPYTTTESNIGMVNVPDKRLDKLSEMEQPHKTTPNTVEFIDIAGLAKGASQGEGLGNQFLDSIRYCEALIHIVRCFEDDNVVHINNSVDPIRDKEEVDIELQFKDLEVVEKSIERNKKAAKGGDKKTLFIIELLEKIKSHLENGGYVRDLNFNNEENKILKSYSFLTSKKILYVANVGDDSLEGNKYTEALAENIKEEEAEMLILNAKLESEIAEIEEAEEKAELMEMYDLKEPGVNRLIRSAYKLLDLITFFTVGKKEVRAWSTPKNSTAPQAAGVIHSDFERGFIRAEMIKYTDYVELGTEQACKDAAKFHVVGKDYVVQDGDQLHFLFNV